jgi:small-conductance mechanosensitive channel
MTGFGDHSVTWEVAVWITDAWALRPAVSRVHEAMWEALQREGIVIAFPQLDLHFDPPVQEAFDRLSSRQVA